MPPAGVGRARTAVFVLGALCRATPAFADGAGQAFRLEYWAEGHCPDAAEFARQIQTRAPRLRPAQSDEPALGFYAELAEEGGAAVGRLTARSADGREVTREVRGPTCDDVSTALALIAAMAVDPTQPVSPPSAQRLAGPAASEPAVRQHHPPVRAVDLPPAQLLQPRLALAPRWTFGIGGGLGFDSTIAPNPGYGLSVAFEAEGRSGSPWRPLFSLSANRAASPTTLTRGSNVSFTWLSFRMASCPLRLPEDTPLFVRPCAFFDTGVLDGNVEYGASKQDRSRTWFAFGGFARVEALVADEGLSFQLDGGITVPLRRDGFDGGAGAPSAFKPPRSGILGRIGVSYRFQ